MFWGSLRMLVLTHEAGANTADQKTRSAVVARVAVEMHRVVLGMELRAEG